MSVLLRRGVVGVCLLLATAVARGGDEVAGVNALLDRVEEAWAAHDVAALGRCVSDQGFLAVVARPDDPAGPWVGGKKEVLDLVAKHWSPVVRHEFVERGICIQRGAALMRLAVADKLANGQRRLARTWQIALKENDANEWKMCFAMPEIASVVALVESVPGDSVAGRAGLREGDVIVSCDGRGVVNDSVLGDGASAGPRTFVVRRGQSELQIKIDAGPLGARLAIRLLPVDGSQLVAADKPHPVKDLCLDAFRGYVVGDHSRAAALCCPAGFLRIGPARASKISVLSGEAVTERAEADRRRLLARYELATAALVDQQAIVHGDVALATARVDLAPREPGVAKLSAPMDVLVLVKQGGQWRMAASLPVAAEAGLTVSPGGEKVDAATVQTQVSGQKVGIGVGLEPVAGGVRIKNVLPNSPAQRADLKPGTVITAVDGTSTAGMAIENIVKLIGGPEGSKVSLVLRLPDGSTQTVELARGKFAFAPVESRRLGKGILLLRIPRLNATTPRDCRRLLGGAKSGGLRGLVLDLRGCMGGTLQATKAVAELFLPAGTALWGNRLDGQPLVQVIAGGKGANTLRRLPLVVLIDKNTRSAGMLLAHAMKENQRAKLLGQPTAVLDRIRKLVTDRDGQSRLVECGDFFSIDDTTLTGQNVTPDVTLAADLSDEALLDEVTKTLGASPSDNRTRNRAADDPATGNTREPRTWTDATGKHHTVAQYLGRANGKVRLKKPDGTIITVPLGQLSPADRKYVEEHENSDK